MDSKNIEKIIEEVNKIKNPYVDNDIEMILNQKPGFLAILFFYSHNNIINYFIYKKLNKLNQKPKNKVQFIEKFLDKRIPLKVLKEIITIIPEDKLKRNILEHGELKYKSIGLNVIIMDKVINTYIYNYKNIKKSKKITKKPKNKEKLTLLIETLYKEIV